MIQKFADLFESPELRKKILITLGALAVFRVGAAIPIPGINADALKALFEAQRNGFLGFLNIFSGGALGRLSIFSLGVMPYINASIIMSLLQGAHVWAYLDRLSKEGELGRRKLNQLTRYLTLALGAVQSAGLTYMIAHMQPPSPGAPSVVSHPTAGFYAMTILTLTTGTMFVMWLGEQMTEFGIGNGVSLIIFAGIVRRLPSAVMNMIALVHAEEVGLLQALLIAAFVGAVTVAVVWLETAQRKIPVQYAKRVVGRKLYGGAQSYLPLKVDSSGVIAIIFAISLLTMPMTLYQFFSSVPWVQKLTQTINFGGWLYEVIYAALIVFFCYFYNSVSFNPTDLADNMRKAGGFIPGYRPGESTANYIEWVMERITLGGSLAVAAIAVVPDWMRNQFNVPFFFGGTALLIAVGVALDTMGQIEAQMIMRHYEGFLKKGRLKQRWFNVGGS